MEMASHRFGGAVVNGWLLLRQRHVGGACGHRPVGALPARPQEAVGHDGEQRQDGHCQDDAQRGGPWGAESEVNSCTWRRHAAAAAEWTKFRWLTRWIRLKTTPTAVSLVAGIVDQSLNFQVPVESKSFYKILDSSLLSRFRSISRLPLLSKILEKVVLMCVSAWI